MDLTASAPISCCRAPIRTPALGEARRQGSRGPGNAAALVSSWTRRRACRYRESRRFPGVRRGLGDHRRGSAGGLRVDVGQYPDEKGSDARRPLIVRRRQMAGSSGVGLRLCDRQRFSPSEGECRFAAALSRVRRLRAFGVGIILRGLPAIILAIVADDPNPPDACIGLSERGRSRKSGPPHRPSTT